jgi:hypothetical protein
VLVLVVMSDSVLLPPSHKGRKSKKFAAFLDMGMVDPDTDLFRPVRIVPGVGNQLEERLNARDIYTFNELMGKFLLFNTSPTKMAAWLFELDENGRRHHSDSEYDEEIDAEKQKLVSRMHIRVTVTALHLWYEKRMKL